MNNVPSLSRVRIIRMPRGEAPEWVREKWIGLVLPCVYKEDASVARGVLTGSIVCYSAYNISQESALKALEGVSVEAVNWWHDHGYPTFKDALWCFDSECIQEVDKVPTHEEFIRRN